MTNQADSPFKSGARCVIRSHDTYTEVFVDRVHKSGNFTLVGKGSQQWRPYSYRDFGPDNVMRWTADKTGTDRLWDRTSLLLWDATTDAEITAAMAEQRSRKRLTRLQERIERLRVRDVSDSYLLAIELALPPLERTP